MEKLKMVSPNGVKRICVVQVACIILYGFLQAEI